MPAQYPRTIRFEDIRPGDTIEAASDGFGVRITRRGKVARIDPGLYHARAVTEDGGTLAASDSSPATHITLLDRPALPLPTEPGAVIAFRDPSDGRELRAMCADKPSMRGDRTWVVTDTVQGRYWLSPDELAAFDWRELTVSEPEARP